ncbi:hypothetical protein [Rhizobium leguminosarum]|uniref:Uncharacterized protein n=1 Tax=Rhizobium leguminosarum TaxID=384 RepID=A0A2K9ZDM1_RHILE|nr:hypothetical protein [Rhizobium leguminosarum]AUW46320.1 hypothetical protein CUJ84_pRLN1000865 [Rhizobium leguminosarum]
MADVDPSICNERTALSSIEEGWQRRLAAEYSSERSKREKQDVVEVLGLSRQSEALLCQLDDLPYTGLEEALGGWFKPTRDGRSMVRIRTVIISAAIRGSSGAGRASL